MPKEKQKRSERNRPIVVDRIKQARMHVVLVQSESGSRYCGIEKGIGAHQGPFARPKYEARGMIGDFLPNRDNFSEPNATERFERFNRALRSLRSEKLVRDVRGDGGRHTHGIKRSRDKHEDGNGA